MLTSDNMVVNMEKNQKYIIIALIAVIVLLAIGIGLGLLSQQDTQKHPVKNTPANNTTVKNATLVNTTTPTDSESGQYGYCAICGKALSYSEANNEYTQGKVCADCAKNPYYQSGEGAEYANEKLFEAYPDDYAWMNEENSSDDD